MKPSGILLPLALVLAVAACKGFEVPASMDDSHLRARAVTGTRDGVRASAALLKRGEFEPIFGLALDKQGVQPIWMEIENGTGRPLFLMATGVDPEYYAPLEVAHIFRSRYSKDTNRRIDRHLSQLAFDHETPIAPGSSASGFVYTNFDEYVKVVDVDLVGLEWTTSITLFVPDPSGQQGAEKIELLEARFSDPELVLLEEEEDLRRALEGLPCCAQDVEGNHVAPLNVVSIGRIEEVVSGVLRRGYRNVEAPALYAFQRHQDLSGRKRAQWVDAQSHSIRYWQTPLRYRSVPVWLVQVGSPRGGRFATDPDSLDPVVDEPRESFTEDLLYSQSLAKLGFVTGAGCPNAAERGVETDGLRAVMVFEERAIALDEIEFFDWERLTDHR